MEIPNQRLSSRNARTQGPRLGMKTSSTTLKLLLAIDFLRQVTVVRQSRLFHPMSLPIGYLSSSIIWAACQHLRVSLSALCSLLNSDSLAGTPPGPVCAPHPKEVCGDEVEHQMNPEHVHLLATKWLNPCDLAILAEHESLKYKKGRFSLSEQRSIQSALDAYKTVSFYQCTEYFVSLCLR